MVVSSLEIAGRVSTKASPTCVIVYDAEGCISQANRACAELFDVGEDTKLMGADPLQWVVPEHRERFTAFLKSAYTEAQDVVEVEMVGRSGLARWVEHRAIEFRQTPGCSGAGLMTIAYDVTEAHRYQRELESRATQYQALFDAYPDAIYLLDRNGWIRSANAVAEKMHACEIDQLVGRHIAYLDDAASASYIDERLAKCLAGETLRFEVKHVRHDGTTTPLEVIATAVECGGEQLILAIDRDISERVEAQRKLRENEERLRLALASANQGMYDLNLQTHEALASDEYARILGYEPEEFQETTDAWLDRLHPDDREPMQIALKNYVDGDSHEYRVEFRQRMPDGTWKWILSLGEIIGWDKRGKPLRMIGTHTDISDLKEAQAELARRQSQLAQIGRVSLANGLASAVAHELGQPLCAAANYLSVIAHLLEGERMDVASLRENVQLANDTVLRAGRIIHRFQDLFSRRRTKFEPCSWGELIDSSLEMFGSELRDHQVRVEKDYGTELPQINADPILIQQLLLNLIRNACEAMGDVPTERRELSISLRKRADGSGVVMEMKDGGPGIPTAVAVSLFESYRSTKDEGLGMGLSICQMIARAHGGEIKLNQPVPQAPSLRSTFQFL